MTESAIKLVDIVRAAKLQKNVGLFVDAIPYAKFLGISAQEENGALIAKLAFSPTNIGNPILPAIHGGVVGAFLETVAILQLLWMQESVTVPKTITITIDYLRTAGPLDTFGKAIVTKLGSRVANVRAVAWQADPDKPVAGANGNFLLTPGD